MLIHYAYINKDTYFRKVPMQKQKNTKKHDVWSIAGAYKKNR